MCGRFVSATPADQVAAYFGAALSGEGLAPSYNVAPTNDIWAVVTSPEGRRLLEPFHWGLVPGWAKDQNVGLKMINARAETLAEKPVFRKLLERRRCIVPADGFYEWKAVAPGSPKGTAKQPYFIHRADGERLAFAGLWTSWKDPNGPPDKPWLHSVAIITTSANATMVPIHDRMPALLAPSSWDRWLDPVEHDLVGLGALLTPAPASVLTMHAVSRDVGNVRNKGAYLVDPVDLGDAGGGLLFC